MCKSYLVMNVMNEPCCMRKLCETVSWHARAFIVLGPKDDLKKHFTPKERHYKRGRDTYRKIYLEILQLPEFTHKGR